MAGAFRPAAELARESTPVGEQATVTGPAQGLQRITSIEARFDPGGSHAFHAHPNQEEVIYVISGRIEQWIDRERRELSAGDAVAIDAGTVHATFNDGDEPATILAILSPCVGDTGYEVVELADQEPWRSLRHGGSRLPP